MTNNMTLGRFATLLLLTPLIVPATGSVSFAEDYVGMTNYYKARAEAIDATVRHKTAYGSLLSARAGHIKAQGEYIKSRADAFVAVQNGRKIGQEIHSMKLDNSLKRADVFYKKRKLYDEYRAAHRKKRLSPGEMASLAKKSVPVQLASHQLGYDGTIRWPHILMEERFAANRALLDAIFASPGRGSGSKECYDVKIATDEMKAMLKSFIKDVPSADYLAARKLLDGLAYEARTAPQQKPNRVAVKRPVGDRSG
jgi:hypothetical protein